MSRSYLPIDPYYFDIFENEMKKEHSRVLYFSLEHYPELDECNGKITKIDKNDGNEFFMYFESGKSVRVDRIVVLNGKPGPAYDEYDAYALAPLTCKAGYDEESCD